MPCLRLGHIPSSPNSQPHLPPPSPIAPRRVADLPDLLRGDVPCHQRYRIDHHGGRLVHRRRGLRQPDVRLHMREWLRDDWLEPDHVRQRR